MDNPRSISLRLRRGIINNNRTTAFKWTTAEATGELKLTLLAKYFAVDSAVVKGDSNPMISICNQKELYEP